MLWLLCAAAILGVAIAARAVFNTARQVRDVRRVIDDRRRRRPKSVQHELMLLSVDEISTLTTSPRRAQVRGTPWPDPWASGFDVPEHLLPIYANQLRARAQTGMLATDAAILVAGAFVGVGAGDVVSSISAHHTLGGGTVSLLVVGVLAVMVASQVRITYVSGWRNAADRYRELAVSARSNTTAVAQIVTDDLHADTRTSTNSRSRPGPSENPRSRAEQGN